MADLSCLGSWSTDDLPDGIYCSGSIDVDSASPTGTEYSCTSYSFDFPPSGTEAYCTDAGGFQAVSGGGQTTTADMNFAVCSGDVTVTDGSPVCSGEWMTVAYEDVMPSYVISVPDAQSLAVASTLLLATVWLWKRGRTLA